VQQGQQSGGVLGMEAGRRLVEDDDARVAVELAGQLEC
jgi:hypothetical protein